MQVRATSGRDVVAGTTGASPHNLRARKRCSRATFSWGEKHTDLELVIRKDYQLFCSVLASAWSCPEKWCKQAFQVFKRSAVIS